MRTKKLGGKWFLKRAGLTLIELLAVIFIITLAGAGYVPVKERHGMGMGIAAGVVGGALGFGIVALFYRWTWKRDEERLARLRADYRGIYRVLEVPQGDQPAIMLEGAEIRVGDHGWEAAPPAKARKGLIYLQGLMPDWRTVWHAGFHPNQTERIGSKPSSQYDHWVPYWWKTQSEPCPFPIQPRETPCMDRPHHSGRYFHAYLQSQTGKWVKVKKY